MRRIDNRDKPYGKILAVRSSRERLILPLKPVRTDVARMVEAGVHVIPAAFRPLRLAACRDNSRMEHAAVGRAEMELGNEHRFVERLFRQIALRRGVVDVDAYDVAIPSAFFIHRVGPFRDSRTEVEDIRRGDLHRIAHGAIVFCSDIAVNEREHFVRGVRHGRIE